ncbi:MAG: iron uptake porin [Xenococcaceae cyanobacterium MO_167.B27]|nr:iron uptake porin [Xenococcaceae cyanobacterium MO_167.B27]
MSKLTLVKWVKPTLQATVITSLLGISNSVLAQTTAENRIQQLQQYSREGQTENIDQVTNVNQLRDVSPTDWAYEALRSLVDRYGCIAGYPNQTYRGSRALSRYEFAAGLNSCLNQIERLIASSEAVVRDDIDTINRLTQQFEAELASIGGRIHNLESRTAFLEDNQFSTTTKLRGEVIFGLASVFAGSKNDGDDDIDNVAVFGDRIRLELETSFTGEDLLFTRLSAGNFPAFSDETGTFQGDLAFAEPRDNDLGLEVLFYTFAIGGSTEVLVGTAGVEAEDIVNTVSVLDGDGGSGAISTFGTRNPIYQPPGDAGLGITQRFGDTIELSAGYLASPANEAEEGSGIFDGPYSAIAQITFTPVDSLTIAATYIHSRNQVNTETGSNRANIDFFVPSLLRSLVTREELEEIGGFEIDAVSDSYGLQFSWALRDDIVIGAWGGLSKVTVVSGNGLTSKGTQDVWNWAATIAFPDLGKPGSMGGIIIGMEPWVTDSNIEVLSENTEDDDTSFHIEVFYEYQFSDNISITPGIVWITAPDNNSDNDDLIIGAIRTTFSF